MSEPAFLFKNKAAEEAGSDVGNHVDVDHAVRRLRMRQDMQAAPAIILDQQNRLSDN